LAPRGAVAVAAEVGLTSSRTAVHQWQLQQQLQWQLQQQLQWQLQQQLQWQLQQQLQNCV
jgi:hypothetical protein